MEDQQGNTHLFYRIYSYSTDSVTGEFQRYNNIYHLDLGSGTDTLFLEDYIVSNILISAKLVEDYDLWNQTAELWNSCGGIGGDPDIAAYIERFDGFPNYNALGMANSIQISRQDDSLVFAGTDASGINGLEATIKSIDGGWNWTQVSDTYEFLSLNPFNDQVLLAQDLYPYSLFKSSDYGNSFIIVDTCKALLNYQFSYDQDGNHVNRILRNYYSGKYEYKVSPNQGSAFSWQTKYSSDSEIFISNDESVSGTIYIADKKNIFVSADYGDNFSLYKTLERKIVGIYKKPNSNKLYAATKYKIYEITPDTIQVIKSLPIADAELKFYPLAIGNKWVYDTWGWWWDGTIYHTYSGIIYREVVDDSIMPNGYNYYKLSDPTTFNYLPILFERIDTTSGKVFRYDNTLGLPDDEYLIDDLFAELGDTIWSSRHQYQDFVPFICVGGGVFNKWGIQGPRKIFTIYDLTGYTYSLSQGVGIDSIYSSFDFGENFTTLKGCIIDGVVYGDTTTVGVEDEEIPIVANFNLEQNYPNPFNPSTKIKFTIPNVETHRDASLQKVTLKIYDILGNEIATLVNEELSAGVYEVEFNGSELTSGIYFYVLKAGLFIQTKKMVYLK